MAKQPATEELKARFWELAVKKAEVIEATREKREAREVIREQIAVLELELKPLNEELRILEAPLYDIDVERAAVARALGGKTGEDPRVV